MYSGKVPHQLPVALWCFLVLHTFSVLILTLNICKNTYKCKFYKEQCQLEIIPCTLLVPLKPPCPCDNFSLSSSVTLGAAGSRYQRY